MEWSDLRIFLAVARAGTLSGAARSLGLSQPTVGRRLRALETAIGAALFERTLDGCVPTPKGEMLLPMAEAMDSAAATIERRQPLLSDQPAGAVRITSGEWMGRFLARHAMELTRQLPALQIELAVSVELASLARREADIAIRNRRPETGDLWLRAVAKPAYAPYATEAYLRRQPRGSFDPADARWDWVTFDEAHAHFPTARWVMQQLGKRPPRLRCSTSGTILEAVLGGAGIALLPCFIADGTTSLQRLSPPIDELAGDVWLIVHRDLRRVPRVRATVDQLVELFRRERRAFAGG
jgi:DNA-binding transcriptional LysR family regulator